MCFLEMGEIAEIAKKINEGIFLKNYSDNFYLAPFKNPISIEVSAF